MGRSIDKNDVDISKLFAWNKEITINYYGKEIKAFVRLVGDAEINRARVFALRKSAELRKKLRDETSDEFLAFIPEFVTVKKEELINGLLAMQTKEITSEAISEIKIPLPVEPTSESTLEEQEKYQAEIDSYPEKRDKLIRDYVMIRIQEEQKNLQDLSKEELYKKYCDMAVNQLCEGEMLKRYREMCSYFGTYSDKKFTARLFETYEDYDNAPTDVKTQLLDEYLMLEIDGEVLKKLPEVTQ